MFEFLYSDKYQFMDMLVRRRDRLTGKIRSVGQTALDDVSAKMGSLKDQMEVEHEKRKKIEFYLDNL